jgi:hypothetical protein
MPAFSVAWYPSLLCVPYPILPPSAAYCNVAPLNEVVSEPEVRPPSPLLCCSFSIICISVLGMGGVALLISVFTFSTSVTQLLQNCVVEVEHQAYSYKYELQ